MCRQGAIGHLDCDFGGAFATWSAGDDACSGSSDSPGGSAPLVIDHDSGLVPPDATMSARRAVHQRLEVVRGRGSVGSVPVRRQCSRWLDALRSGLGAVGQADADRAGPGCGRGAFNRARARVQGESGGQFARAQCPRIGRDPAAHGRCVFVRHTDGGGWRREFDRRGRAAIFNEYACEAVCGVGVAPSDAVAVKAKVPDSVGFLRSSPTSY